MTGGQRSVVRGTAELEIDAKESHYRLARLMAKDVSRKGVGASAGKVNDGVVKSGELKEGGPNAGPSKGV